MQGVGMILPIEASMHTPAHFDGVLAGTMAAVTALYVGFGSVGIMHPVKHKPWLILLIVSWHLRLLGICLHGSAKGPSGGFQRNIYTAIQQLPAVAAGGLYGIWRGDARHHYLQPAARLVRALRPWPDAALLPRRTFRTCGGRV